MFEVNPKCVQFVQDQGYYWLREFVESNVKWDNMSNDALFKVYARVQNRVRVKVRASIISMLRYVTRDIRRNLQ